MSDGGHDRGHPLRPGDPKHYSDFLYRTDAVLFSLELDFQVAAAEEPRPKDPVGSDDGADESSGSEVCYHAHYTEAEVDDLLDIWLRSRMFGDPTSLRELVAFAYGIIRVLAENLGQRNQEGDQCDDN